MSMPAMNAMQRTLTALGHREPDRVPFFLLTYLQGARELGLSIRDYYSRAENIVEGQTRLQQKFRSDCLSPFSCAALETQAWGMEIIFSDDGPPLAGGPLIHRPEDIDRVAPPRVADSPGLLRALAAIEGLRARFGDAIPILGVAISPFSLPVMQMGFDAYIELIHEHPGYFARLMDKNIAFCVDWANAQLQAGATAIVYFDPVSSCTCIPRELYLRTGQAVARRTLPQIRGATATHMASGRCLPIMDDLAGTGTAAVGVSTLEDLGQLKAVAGGRLSIVGNLDGIAMRRWSAAEAERQVRRAIARAGRGGGFILADNHGEIPWQVPDEVLLAIADAVERWGRYPLDWIGNWQEDEPA